MLKCTENNSAQQVFLSNYQEKIEGNLALYIIVVLGCSCHDRNELEISVALVTLTSLKKETLSAS